MARYEVPYREVLPRPKPPLLEADQWCVIDGRFRQSKHTFAYELAGALDIRYPVT